MIIEFSVTNFCSFRGRQTLSLVASNRVTDLPENVLEVDIPGMQDTSLLKSAAVYGANASGKTNLFRAMAFMRDLVVDSAVKQKPGQEIRVSPFRLDAACASAPSEFEINFIHEDTRYQYGFVVDRKRVSHERLYAYPAGLPQRWFERTFVSATEKYQWRFSPHFNGDKETLKSMTRDNVLFLSLAAQLNDPQMTTVYRWFHEHLRLVDFLSPLAQENLLRVTAQVFLDPLAVQGQEAVRNLIAKADLGLCDVKVEEKVIDDSVFERISSQALRVALRDTMAETKVTNVSWVHRMIDGAQTVAFSEADESAGTLKFFSLLVPWLATLSDGYTLFVDEIGASIHPLLLRSLLDMMHNPKTNSQGAQLVFTTHDTTLLDHTLFRRDQVWFTEKDPEGATCLYPLTDYKPRKKEALQKGYLAGRYGAIPFLTEFTF